ncbi:MAG: 4Fe-4S binding protein [Bacillota bacterium]
MVQRRHKGNWFRLAIQVFFFALIALIAVNHGLAESSAAIPILSTASLHAVCPFGGVVSIYQYLTVGTYTKKIHESSFILMYIVMILTIGFGAVFCGWVCPFGSFQEWLGKLGRKLFPKSYNNLVPQGLDKFLRVMPYGVLAWVLYMTAVTGKLSFQGVDPYYALFQFWTGEVATAAFFILGMTILTSLVVERAWCKYACPYGAVLGLVSYLRIFKITRNAGTCTGCKACDRVCPVNIKVSETGVVRHHQCNSCLQCTSEGVCPVPATVELAMPGGKPLIMGWPVKGGK